MEDTEFWEKTTTFWCMLCEEPVADSDRFPCRFVKFIDDRIEALTHMGPEGSDEESQDSYYRRVGDLDIAAEDHENANWIAVSKERIA